MTLNPLSSKASDRAVQAARYEPLVRNAHPARKILDSDGWLLHFTDGYTRRANSVQVTGASTTPLERHVAYCEDVYTRAGLPTVFKLTDSTPASLDALLERLGYAVRTPTLVQVLDPIGRAADGPLPEETKRFSGAPPEWRRHSFRLSGLSDPDAVAAAVALLDRIRPELFTVQIASGDAVVASGRCVVEDRTAGLYDIVVDARFRRRGYGEAVCRALLREAANRGAGSAYLQVMAENASALALYRKLGFATRYSYWYREKDLRT